MKFMAAHHLSINIGKRLSVGLFEAVVLNRDDGFELGYLNPVILYRTVEGNVGSPDNVLIGLTSSYHLPFRTEVYGQFILDEFVYDELFVKKRGGGPTNGRTKSVPATSMRSGSISWTWLPSATSPALSSTATIT